ncbi:MAG: ATP-binding cassette domain-containing protein [Burkholderiales bacterium]
MSMRPPVLETHGLSKSFGGVVAVDNVDLRLEEGELRCLIGPNGAGKSTFFKMLCGQLKPTAGRVTLRGVDITTAEPHEIARRGVGIKTQVPNLFDGLSVHEHLWLAARRHAADRDATRIVDETLTRIRMHPRAARRVGELAHGERQWVELGVVLAGDPQLVLLDEPTAGMTQQEVAATAELLGTLRGERALIVVEHDMHFVRMIAERVTVLHQGRILMNAHVDDVMRDARVRDIYLGRHASAAVAASP